MFTKDFIMRQIELMAAGAAKIFNKDVKKEEEELMEFRASDDCDSLISRLYDLVDEGKLCQAEDELFFYCKENPTAEVFGIAVEFYNTLESFSDQDLQRFDFPREDIAKGLSAILAILNEQ